MPDSDDYFVDPERVQQARMHLFDNEHARRLAETFKALGDPTRVRLLHALLHAELTVGDLARLLEMEDSLSAISHHLRLLRSLHIVRDRREGKQVYYTLDNGHIASILRHSHEHINA